MRSALLMGGICGGHNTPRQIAKRTATVGLPACHNPVRSDAFELSWRVSQPSLGGAAQIVQMACSRQPP